jgi:hypothetical protein
MTVASTNDSWGFFSEREMSSTAPEMTAEQEAAATAKWAEITTAAAAHGGLEAYGNYLLAEEEKAHTEFCKFVELAIPTFASDYNWYVQGSELIGADQYGNQSIIISFRLLRKKLGKGLSIQDIVKKEVSFAEYWEE